eukprot:15445576-Alexandrium_andersonii.AAC.5
MRAHRNAGSPASGLVLHVKRASVSSEGALVLAKRGHTSTRARGCAAVHEMRPLAVQPRAIKEAFGREVNR